MKILITNDGLSYFCGTETWVYAMCEELSKEHEVRIFANHHGKMADILKDKMTTDLTGFDLALINHTATFYKVPKRTFKIFTTHSKFVDIEQPPEEAEYVVGVTEYIYPKVIRNGVNCERFKPTKINKKLKNILYLSNPSYSEGQEIIRQACEGYNLIILEEERFDIENLINEADFVISLGRGALESMACGKVVLYGDYRRHWMSGFMGEEIITPRNYNQFKSGEWQKTRHFLSVEQIKQALAKYDYRLGEWGRRMILKDFNIKKTAKQYLDIWINSKKGT